MSNIGVRSVNILHGYLDGFALSVGIVDGDEVYAFGCGQGGVYGGCEGFVQGLSAKVGEEHLASLQS